MKANRDLPHSFMHRLIVSLSILLGLGLASCSLMPLSGSESARQTEIRATELDIRVKQTLLALQQTDRPAELTALAGTVQAPQQTMLASPAASTPTLLPATNAMVTPEAVQTTELPPPTGAATPGPIDEAAFQTWMKSARILLYEDMIARLDTVRFVKSALDEMGLPYKDDGSAYGWLLDDLEQGPEGGGAWDLIIIAAEDKAGVQANFFNVVLNAVDQGTSTILEVWYLNNTYNNVAREMLTRCGIEYENDWVRIPPSGAALFALNPEDPVLQQPNSGLSFTATSSFWWDPEGNKTYDVGDLVGLTVGSQARLLLGTTPNINTSHAVSTVCMDGKLILQTFSSHVLTFNTMLPLWENYIYNALLTRFANLH